MKCVLLAVLGVAAALSAEPKGKDLVAEMRKLVGSGKVPSWAPRMLDHFQGALTLEEHKRIHAESTVHKLAALLNATTLRLKEKDALEEQAQTQTKDVEKRKLHLKELLKKHLKKRKLHLKKQKLHLKRHAGEVEKLKAELQAYSSQTKALQEKLTLTATALNNEKEASKQALDGQGVSASHSGMMIADMSHVIENERKMRLASDSKSLKTTAQVMRMQQDLAKAQSEIAHLKETVGHKDGKIQGLEKDTIEASRDMRELKQELDTQTKEIAQEESSTKALKKEMSNLRGKDSDEALQLKKQLEKEEEEHTRAENVANAHIKQLSAKNNDLSTVLSKGRSSFKAVQHQLAHVKKIAVAEHNKLAVMTKAEKHAKLEATTIAKAFKREEQKVTQLRSFKVRAAALAEANLKLKRVIVKQVGGLKKATAQLQKEEAALQHASATLTATAEKLDSESKAKLKSDKRVKNIWAKLMDKRSQLTRRNAELVSAGKQLQKAKEQDVTLKEKLSSKSKQVKELLKKDAVKSGDLGKLKVQFAKLETTRAELNLALGESKASKGLLAAKLQTSTAKLSAAVADESAARREAEEEASKLSAANTKLERAEDGPHVDKVEAMKVELSSAKELVKDFNATAVEQSVMLKEAAEEQNLLTHNLETQAKAEEAEKKGLIAKEKALIAEEKALKEKLERATSATVEKKLKEDDEKVAKLSSALLKEHQENDELRHELPSAAELKKHSLRASA